MSKISGTRAVHDFGWSYWRRTGASAPYYTLPALNQTLSGFSVTNGQLIATPFIVSKPQVADSLCVRVTSSTAGAGSVTRLGIYSDSGSIEPGALALDAGEVSITTTGVKELTGLNHGLSTGLYWLVNFTKLVSGSASIACLGTSYPLEILGHNDSNNGYKHITGTASYGVMPNLFPAITLSSANAGLVWVRFSS